LNKFFFFLKKKKDNEEVDFIKNIMSELNNTKRFIIEILEDNNQITNIFFICREFIKSFINFTDVISFDTTFATENTNKKLALFIGIDNYFKSTILAGAYI